MTQQVKRVDPYWHTHPMIPTGVAVGAILALIGYLKAATVAGRDGGSVAALAILFAARPVLSPSWGPSAWPGGCSASWSFPTPTRRACRALKFVAALMFAVF